MNFEAIIKATLDTAQAKSQLDAFIQNAHKPITIPVNFGKQGGQAGRNFADAFQSSLNKIDLKNGGIGNVRRMLQGAGFDTSSISLVTKELDKMSLSISKIQTKQLQNGNIRMNITGVDELQRGVTIVREFDKETGKVANTSKTFTQTFAESISKAQTKVQQFNQLQAEAFGNQMSAWASDNSKAFNAYSTELGNLYTRLQTAISSKDGNAVKQIQEEFKLLQSEAKATGNIGNEVAKQFTTSLNSIKIDTFDKQITAWSRNNSKAMNAMMESTTTTYGEQIAEYHRQIQQLQNDITNSPTGITEAHVNRFREIQDGMRNLQAEAKATGNVGKSFGEQFTSAFGSIAKFAASYVSIRQVFNTIRDGIKTVNELDDALVDLQKTTTATPQQLNKFYGEANDIAKQYGTTTKQIIQGAAD